MNAARIIARIRRALHIKGLDTEFLFWDGVDTEKVADSSPEEIAYIVSLLGPADSQAYTQHRTRRPKLTVQSLRRAFTAHRYIRARLRQLTSRP